MSLNFPNQCRSYDATRNRVRFWGHDSALEISFFVEASALYKLNPETREVEGGLLETFDAERDRIHEAASKAYSRGRTGPYLLAAADF